MSWPQATGINAFCAAGANAGATHSASLTGFSAAIPRESVSGISLGLVRKEIISRCFGRPFGIRVLGCRGLISNTNGVAAPGASTNGWFSRRHNSGGCSERTNARQVGRSDERSQVQPATAGRLWERGQRCGNRCDRPTVVDGRRPPLQKRRGLAFPGRTLAGHGGWLPNEHVQEEFEACRRHRRFESKSGVDGFHYVLNSVRRAST